MSAHDDLRQRCIDWRAAQEANDRDDALIVVKVGPVEALLDVADAARAFVTLDGGTPCFDPEGCSGCKLNAAVARLDALTQTALPSPASDSETSA